MKTDKEFPNGFENWVETHYEVVSEITSRVFAPNFDIDRNGTLENRYRVQGIGGMYELSEELTDEFEKEFEGELWEGDAGYFETLEIFLNNKLS